MTNKQSRAVAVLTVFVVVAASVAGHALAGAPTKASWAKAANTICASVNAKVERLPRATSTAILIDDLRAVGRISLAGTAQLTAIPRPAGERASIGTLLAIVRNQNRIVAVEIVPALQRGESTAAAPSFTKLNKLGSQYNAIARRLGASVCALNPQPSG